MIPISKPLIGEAERDAVLAVLESGMLVQGSRVALLEEAFAEISGTKHAIATSTGTSALHVALLAHNIGPGDEVITTPFTFIASTNSILYTGAQPVFVDIEYETFNLNPALIEASITKKTKAILLVHLYGLPCNMEAIKDIAERHNLLIIEDAAQAIGADYKGQMVGSFGTGCFSLYATKNAMSVEGGMITTNNDEIAHRCKLLRNHGMQQRYYYEMLGFNFRLSDLHAAIGLVQIGRLREFTEKRRANAEFLNKHLTNVITPYTPPNYGHVWHQYTIRLNGQNEQSSMTRDRAVQRLTEAGIGTGIFYPVPAHQQAYIQQLGIAPVSLPETNRAANEVISLPIHPHLSQDDLDTIVSEVNKL